MEPIRTPAKRTPVSMKLKNSIFSSIDILIDSAVICVEMVICERNQDTTENKLYDDTFIKGVTSGKDFT